MGQKTDLGQIELNSTNHFLLLTVVDNFNGTKVLRIYSSNKPKKYLQMLFDTGLINMNFPSQIVLDPFPF